MAKIQHFKIKAIVDAAGVIALDHSTKEVISNGEGSEFDESRIAFKAQEVAEFNKGETELCKQLGKGEYTIEYKLIV